MKVIGNRPNPLNEGWNEWTLFACIKCRAIQERQHHSDEQMHGGDLEITALATPEYLQKIYQINIDDLDEILEGKKMVRLYNRHTKNYAVELSYP